MPSDGADAGEARTAKGARDGSRPLSALAAIAVAGVTAVVVIAVGVFFAERGEPPRVDGPLPVPPLPSIVLPPEGELPVVAATRVEVAAIADAGFHADADAGSPLPATSAVVDAGVAPPEPARPIVDAGGSAPATPPLPTAAPVPTDAPTAPAAPAADVPADRAILIGAGPAGAHVYVNGSDAGAVGERLSIPCGARYLRIGVPPATAAPGAKPSSVTWVGAGKSVVVACGVETRFGAPP